MTLRLAASFAFSLLPLIAGGQQPDHLLPEDSVYAGGALGDYGVTVGTVLGRTLPLNSPKMIVIPSFRNEYVVGLDRQRCLVVWGEAQFHLWMHQARGGELTDEAKRILATFPDDPLDVQVSIKQQSLDRGLCERIAAAWKNALLGTRYSSVPPSYLLTDGVLYHFSTWVSGLGTLAGRSHSPERESFPGKMVALGEAMRRFADTANEQDRRALEAALDTVESLVP